MRQMNPGLQNCGWRCSIAGLVGAAEIVVEIVRASLQVSLVTWEGATCPPGQKGL